MAELELVMPKYVKLKNRSDVNEKWLQDKLAKNPELLGLGGELIVLGTEITQPSGGRFDLLLADSEADRRYEVEVQLGKMNPDHIIRTIEYWDIQRRRYPQYEHIAVIVAEEVTGRFHNVIPILNSNRAIPLIAIQLQGLEVKEGEITLVATRVVDLPPRVEEEDDSGGGATREDWEGKKSVDSVKIVDGLIEIMQKTVPGVKAKYTKAYIIPEYDGKRFVEFYPNKADVRTGFVIPRDDELTERIGESELRFTQYRYGKYWVKVGQPDLDDHSEILDELIKRAYAEAIV